MILAAVQHERAPRSTSSLVAAARRGPSGLYPGIPQVYHAASNPYHPLLYPALFPFKPTMPAFPPSIGKRNSYSGIQPFLIKLPYLRTSKNIPRYCVRSLKIFEPWNRHNSLICSTLLATSTDGTPNSDHRQRGRSDKLRGSWNDRLKD